MTILDARLVQALNDLWSVRDSRNGFCAKPAFKVVEQVCADLYEEGSFSISRLSGLEWPMHEAGIYTYVAIR